MMVNKHHSPSLNQSIILFIIFGLILLVSLTQRVTPSIIDKLLGDSPFVESTIDYGYLLSEHPSQVDNSNIPITPVNKLHTTGSAPEIDITNYRLTISGQVDSQFSLTYAVIQQYPVVSDVVLLVCPGFFYDNAEWTGVPVSRLLGEAGITENASRVVFHAVDGYRASLPIEEALGDGVFLAYKVNGQTLPKEHGYPLRLVISGEYGGKWVKWVDRIEVK
jgi:sulfoxide reductase catalytic subunit YedY